MGIDRNLFISYLAGCTYFLRHFNDAIKMLISYPIARIGGASHDEIMDAGIPSNTKQLINQA